MFWAHISFFSFCSAKHLPLCTLYPATVDIVCPWPKSQDESYRRPFCFLWVVLQGKIITRPFEWTCQVWWRSRQNQECSTKANKADYFLSITSKSDVWLPEYEAETEREKSFKWSWSSGVLLLLVQFSRWPKFYTTRIFGEGGLFYCHVVLNLVTLI